VICFFWAIARKGIKKSVNNKLLMHAKFILKSTGLQAIEMTVSKNERDF
jgi:hypothetical protein